MEQAPALTFSDSTAVTESTAPASAPAHPIAEDAPSTSSPILPASPAETIRPTEVANPVERAAQHGLYTGSLEEEVGQVMGALTSWGGSLWGGVKKQSASALQTIKSDLDKTIVQAQQDLKYLQTAKVEVVTKDSATFEAEQAADKERRSMEAQAKDKGKGKERAVDAEGELSASSSTLPIPASASALFSKIQNSTSHLQHTLQQTVHNTLASNPNLTNPTALRAQLAENLKLDSAKQNLQISMKQAEKLAEEYLKKSEGWMKEAEKWVEDAVKVVPPTDDQHSGMVWDGSDFYSFSTSTNSPIAKTFPNRDAGVGALGSMNLAGSRKEALLRRLREDKELLLVDPAGEGETEERKKEFADWVKGDWEKEGKEGREKEEGNVGTVRMALVPEHLSDEQFWQRYLFHKHMIEAEEEKRKLLLQATTQSQPDDFSWDDEEEPSASPTSNPLSQSTTTLHPSPDVGKASPPTVIAVPPTTPATTSTSTSPRESEESYDLVSDQGKKRGAVKEEKKEEDDEDSDWE
ncbi:hypothetical protein P7C73_g2302, partial [Tremellales sp. Uapishka_1]